jgi:hypothetical protein
MGTQKMKRIYKFCTYIWLREDGSPYYVGKCSRTDRAFSKHKHVGEPPRDDLILLQEFPSEEDAYTAEIFLIAYYGRKDLKTGCLANLTDGGEGYHPSQAIRDKISKAIKDRVVSTDTKKLISESVKKSWAKRIRKHSEESILKMKKAHKGRVVVLSKASRQKQSETQKRLGIKPPSRLGFRKIKEIDSDGKEIVTWRRCTTVDS